jgi:nitroimidazol reductase NimA-like FMN-containing flavoprotein (pyridoxamine 5'-phosphate oxidase superfamily)
MYQNDEPSIRDKISELAKEQLFGVLCTQNNEQPYGSMIGFALSNDLKNAVFATPKATRKYRNLTKCQNVALVVNNREKHPSDLMKIQAFTAIGKAEEIIDYNSQSFLAKMLIDKQSYLSEFLESPTPALFRIKIKRYFYVCSFQEVREWEPE